MNFPLMYDVCLGGVSGVAYFITIDKQLQYNRGCYFRYTEYAVLESYVSLFSD